MNKYQTKPEIVEAVQWDGSSHTANTFIGDGYTTDWEYVSAGSEDITINTPAWWKSRVRIGEWIIKGNDGAVFGCSNAVFQRRYVALDAEEAQG